MTGLTNYVHIKGRPYLLSYRLVYGQPYNYIYIKGRPYNLQI